MGIGRYRISLELLIDRLRTGAKWPSVQIDEGLPADAEIIGAVVRIGSGSQWLELTAKSSTFPDAGVIVDRRIVLTTIEPFAPAPNAETS